MKTSAVKKVNGYQVSPKSTSRRVAITFPKVMFEKINKYSQRHGVSFAEATRTFIKMGIQ